MSVAMFVVAIVALVAAGVFVYLQVGRPSLGEYEEKASEVSLSACWFSYLVLAILAIVNFGVN